MAGGLGGLGILLIAGVAFLALRGRTPGVLAAGPIDGEGPDPTLLFLRG